ncbi:homoserine dehydrogenase [Lacicoccus alkaliphilus]|uniref:Homoserine dehydrogenase n=1 Tax=Lacicoccus alkaliphilus DSM 16010 TaxID=1123231 RepID=A0A1M7BR17_9BACL|nr:homoserine dehydrogenase [Salinicoccus alkaliphilus]SHL57363.1 homoserine dehydrogenase [Salinicoccus alkaliphilus DSM 16010]
MKIAVLGMGTVGTGVVKVLNTNKEKIQSLIGGDVTITHVFAKNVDKARDVDLSDIEITDDINDIYNADIDAAVEVMGGIDHTYEIILQLLNKGVHVVTANKDLLAERIDDLTAAANENNVHLNYEAAVAGGVPIIRTIENSLNANQISEVMGILNGTTNYILTKMTVDGWSYDDALEDAKEKGYAEADPTNDVEGIDALRKIVLLSRLSFNKKVDIKDVPSTGISNVDATDIQLAKDLGYIMKLVGIGKYDDSISASVEPIFFKADHQLASVNYEKNAVYVNGNAVGETMYYGPGAGSLETASAVVSDLIHVLTHPARGNFQPDEEAVIENKAVEYQYYLRFDDTEEEVKKALVGKDIGHKLSTASGAVVAVTEKLNENQLEDVLEGLNAKAQYPVIGDE